MTPETITQEQTKFLENHDKTNHCVPIKEIQVMATKGYFRLQACILSTTSLHIVHVWMRTQETLEGKRKVETCHHKRVINVHRRQQILGRFDVQHSWDHPANVRFLNLRSFMGGNSFFRPCHLIHVHSLATRQNPNQIHRGQSSLRAHGSNLRHQSEEISHRQ